MIVLLIIGGGGLMYLLYTLLTFEHKQLGYFKNPRPAPPRPLTNIAKGTSKYRYCNHHHELTDQHIIVDFGDGEFVANKDGIPLLKALNEIGLKTRTHHIEGEYCFISILLDDVEVSVRTVNERDSTRTKYNGKKELLIQWKRKL